MITSDLSDSAVKSVDVHANFMPEGTESILKWLRCQPFPIGASFMLSALQFAVNPGGQPPETRVYPLVRWLGNSK